MNVQMANLATDLRRISNWVVEGKSGMVKDYIDRIKPKYQINHKVGKYDDIWLEITAIGNTKGGRMKAAERATTLGSILLQESLKPVNNRVYDR